MPSVAQRLYRIACAFPALLNLCDPGRYDRFNLGEALQTLDSGNMGALLEGIQHAYAGECEG